MDDVDEVGVFAQDCQLCRFGLDLLFVGGGAIQDEKLLHFADDYLLQIASLHVLFNLS